MTNELDKLIEEGRELESTKIESNGMFDAYRARLEASSMNIEKFNIWIPNAIDYLERINRAEKSESIKVILEQYNNLVINNNRRFFEIVIGKLESLKSK